MASAQEIESYKGDSALAGGFGAQGTQNVISGVWKMADTVNESFNLLRAAQFKKSREEYTQRIKDRDELADMISSDKLNVDKLSDEDRLNANSKIQELRNSLIDMSKNGKISDDKSFLEIKKKYAEIVGGINNKNVNNIAIESDRLKYENQYDDGYEKHKVKENELMAKDPNHKYQPYVPLFKYDNKKVFAPLITDKKETPIGKRQKEVVEIPNIAKTFDDTGNLYVTQDGRKQIMSAYDELINGGNISSELIDNANIKLKEIALKLPENERQLLKPIDIAVDSPAMVIAKQRIAMGYGNIDTKPKRLFNSESDARLYEEEAKNKLEIEKERVKNKLEIEKERVKNKLEIEKENAKSRNTIKEQNNAARKAANKPGSDGTAVAVDKDNFPNIYNAQNDLKSSLSNRELLTESKISKKDVQKLVDNVAKNTNIKIPVGSKLYKVDVADLPPAINTKFKGLGADEVIMVENDNGFNIYVTDVADDYKVYSEYDLLRLTTGESKDAKEEWNKIDRAGVSKEPQVEKTNSKKPEWTGEFDSKGKMIFK
jgi:hypothetical protein